MYAPTQRIVITTTTATRVRSDDDDEKISSDKWPAGRRGRNTQTRQAHTEAGRTSRGRLGNKVRFRPHSARSHCLAQSPILTFNYRPARPPDFSLTGQWQPHGRPSCSCKLAAIGAPRSAPMNPLLLSLARSDTRPGAHILIFANFHPGQA